MGGFFMSVASDGRIKFIPLDAVGRLRAYGTVAMAGKEFLALMHELDDEAPGAGATRWAVRGLVGRDAFPDSEPSALLTPGGPLELNRLPVVVDDEQLDYVWLARNLGDRVPAPDRQHTFLGQVRSRVAYQDEFFPQFHERSVGILDQAAELGNRVVVNDPFGKWGTDRVDGNLFCSLLQNFFYFSPELALTMLHGTGYSTHGHYVFSLVNAGGEVLCIFILARFAWGFEGTYIIENPNLPSRTVAGAARVLMLIANALVLDRHGDQTLLYGEANVRSMRAIINAGYEVVPPVDCEPFSPVHRNIVWADNPIGGRTPTHTVETILPPSYQDVEYAHYALMRARNELIKPLRQRAYELLSV